LRLRIGQVVSFLTLSAAEARRQPANSVGGVYLDFSQKKPFAKPRKHV